MNTVIVSEKYQVVIPKEIREQAGLKPGTKVEVLCYGNRIELVPIQPLSNLKGIFKDIDTGIERELDR
jgi:AbrB family looped-hinge helix DNA binding protein